MKLRMLWHLVDCAFPLPAAAPSCRRAEAEPAVLTASALTLKSGGRIYEVTAEWRTPAFEGTAAFSYNLSSRSLTPTKPYTNKEAECKSWKPNKQRKCVLQPVCC